MVVSSWSRDVLKKIKSQYYESVKIYGVYKATSSVIIYKISNKIVVKKITIKIKISES